MASYVVYSMENCSFCQRAKSLLEVKGFEYREIVMGKDITREALLEACQHYGHGRTMPLIVMIDEHGNEQHVGGYEELSNSLK